ncbi:MAG: hypothetical protein HYV07_33610 [Deltaproteobacteria bacterium]|nr:hypothetical protein [Deltaproteobacteria bacterium]
MLTLALALIAPVVCLEEAADVDSELLDAALGSFAGALADSGSPAQVILERCPGRPDELRLRLFGAVTKLTIVAERHAPGVSLVEKTTSKGALAQVAADIVRTLFPERFQAGRSLPLVPDRSAVVVVDHTWTWVTLAAAVTLSSISAAIALSAPSLDSSLGGALWPAGEVDRRIAANQDRTVWVVISGAAGLAFLSAGIALASAEDH